MCVSVDGCGFEFWLSLCLGLGFGCVTDWWFLLLVRWVCLGLISLEFAVLDCLGLFNSLFSFMGDFVVVVCC